MRGHRNYTSIIRTILLFKSFWLTIATEKFKPLLDTLSNYQYYDDFDNIDKMPSNKEISDLMELPRSKVNQLTFKANSEIKINLT